MLSVLKQFLREQFVKVNPDGGALGFGVCPGSTGAMLLLNAANRLKYEQDQYAVVCVPGEVGDFGVFLLARA